MRYFPMFLDFGGRTVLIAGGGEQAAQKARLLTRTEAELLLMAPALEPELQALVSGGGAAHVAAAFDAEAVATADYLFIATGDDALDGRIAIAARAAGALVNMVDRPEACDMITPAIVDRDPVVIAIGTEGAAPVLARKVKTMLEERLSPRLGSFVAMLQAMRPDLARVEDSAARLRLWDWAATGEPWRRWLAGDEAGARALIGYAADMGRAIEEARPALTVVEIPVAPDLLPLRAVERMQDAATIFHPEGLDPDILDLARRDAARVILDDATTLEGAAGPVVLLCEDPGHPPLTTPAPVEIVRAAKP